MAERSGPPAYAPLAVRDGAYPPSPRLFTEADLRAAVEAVLSHSPGDTREAPQEFLDGWLCEPYRNEGAPPHDAAVERAARAIFLDRNPEGDWNAERVIHHVWRRCAKAALEAALNMTEAQSRAYVDEEAPS